MKTTIEVADRLLAEAKRVAARAGTTLRALVEAGLHQQLAQRSTKAAPPFVLRDASVDGNGLRPELHGAGWEALRDLAYVQHGIDELWTADRDCSRYPALRVRNPLIGG